MGWIRNNLFKGYINSFLTIVILFAAWKIIPPLIQWAFIDAYWFTTAAECQGGSGACWSFIPAKLRLVIFGFYPADSQWRPALAMAILLGLVFYSRNRDHWKLRLLYIWIVGLVVLGILMRGGIFGLQYVEISNWSGLPLTLLLSFFGMLAALWWRTA